jgi:hypothetical protein
MSKDKKGGKQNRPGKEVEDQWKDDFSRDHRFIHSVSGPFTPPTKGKEPSQSGPTSDSDAQGGSASNKRSKKIYQREHPHFQAYTPTIFIYK